MTIKWRIARCFQPGDAARYSRDLDDSNISNWTVIEQDATHLIHTVYAELPTNAIIVTVEGGIVRNIDNLPTGVRVVVLDYDHESEHALSVAIY